MACEFSAIVREAFKKQGHNAWSCDLLDTEIPGQHIKGDVLDILDDGWDLMVAHPPCTYITNAGVRHLHDIASKNGVKAKIHGQARIDAMVQACHFFQKLQYCNIPKLAIENPIPHKYAVKNIGKYDQLVRPWMFGNPENKAICLWLKNLPLLKPTNIIEECEYKIHNMPDTKDRWKNRSRFFPEVADAMAIQWT